MPGVINPYGAVPEALRGLSQTVSEATANAIRSKELDRQMAMDQANLELKKAEVGADVTKAKIGNEFQMAGMEQQERQSLRVTDLEKQKVAEMVAENKRQFGLAVDKLAEDKRVNTSVIKMHDQTIAESKKRERLIGAQMKNAELKAKVQPLGDWLKGTGVSDEAAEFLLPGLSQFATGDISGEDFYSEVFKPLAKAMIEHPELGQQIKVNKIASGIEKLAIQYKQNPTPELYNQLMQARKSLQKQVLIAGVSDRMQKKTREEMYRKEYQDFIKGGMGEMWKGTFLEIQGNDGTSRMMTPDEYVLVQETKKGDSLKTQIGTVIGYLSRLEAPGQADVTSPEATSRMMRRRGVGVRPGYLSRPAAYDTYLAPPSRGVRPPLTTFVTE